LGVAVEQANAAARLLRPASYGLVELLLAGRRHKQFRSPSMSWDGMRVLNIS